MTCLDHSIIVLFYRGPLENPPQVPVSQTLGTMGGSRNHPEDRRHSKMHQRPMTNQEARQSIRARVPGCDYARRARCTQPSMRSECMKGDNPDRIGKLTMHPRAHGSHATSLPFEGCIAFSPAFSALAAQPGPGEPNREGSSAPHVAKAPEPSFSRLTHHVDRMGIREWPRPLNARRLRARRIASAACRAQSIRTIRAAEMKSLRTATAGQCCMTTMNKLLSGSARRIGTHTGHDALPYIARRDTTLREELSCACPLGETNRIRFQRPVYGNEWA